MVLICLLFWMVSSYLVFDKKLSIENPVLKMLVAFFFSISIFSLIFSAFLFAGIGFVVFQAIFLAFPILYLILELKKRKRFFNLAQIKSISFLKLLVILCGLLFFTYNFFMLSIRWGDWDAWAIWTQHAKFLTFDSEFSQLFDKRLEWTHPDYPLMLPSIIAMVWKSFGNFSPYVPAVFSYLTSTALVLLVLTPFMEKKSKLLGIGLFLVLTCSLVLFPFVTGQYSDTLLATFILLPLVLLSILPASNPLFYFSLIGFFAASSGWIKNEGLMYFAIFSFCFFLKYLRQPKFLLHYGLGALFPVLIIVIFKLKFATSNYLMDESGTSNYERFTDVSRYEFIWNYAITYLTENCQFLLISFIAILLLNFRFYLSFAFWVLLLLFCSYFFAYIFSPYGLEWQMSTSFSRLIHQVFPAIIYSIFFSVAMKFSRPAVKTSTDGIDVT